MSSRCSRTICTCSTLIARDEPTTDMYIKQVPPASALAALSIAVPRANVPRCGSDDTVRRSDTVLLTSAAYDRARCARRVASGRSCTPRHTHRATSRRQRTSLHPLYVFRSRASSRCVVLIVSSQVSIWVSLCVLQENQQQLRASRFSGYGSGVRDAEVFDPARAPGPGAGLSVAPEISTRQGFQCLRGNQRAPK